MIFCLYNGFNNQYELQITGKGSNQLNARNDALKKATDKWFNNLEEDKKLKSIVLKNPLNYIENYWILKTEKYSDSFFKIKILVIFKNLKKNDLLNKIKLKNYNKISGE